MIRVADVNELHMDVLGEDVPALFVHGSFGWGLETFPEQRALADQYQVVIIDRCGFGGSASLEAAGFAYAQGSCLRGAMGWRAGMASSGRKAGTL